MRIYGGDYSISYGADIEVFRNALLEIGGGVGANIGLTIVCGDKIKIGKILVVAVMLLYVIIMEVMPYLSEVIKILYQSL